MKLELVNFGPLGTRDFEFNVGLNAVIGPNGTGKSTLVSALYFALTGEAINGQNLDELVTWGFTQASVTLTDTLFRVNRTITPNGTTKIKFESGGKVITRKKEVDQAICELFGFVDLSILKLVFFAEQYRAIDFVEVSDLARIQMLSSLFGFAGLEKLRDKLQAKMRSIETNFVSGDLLLSLETSLQQSTTERDALIAQQNTETSKLLSEDQVRELTEISEAADEDKVFELNERASTIDATLKSLNDKLSSLPEPPSAEQFAQAGLCKRRDELAEAVDKFNAQLVELKQQPKASSSDLTKLRDILITAKAKTSAEIEQAKKRQTLLASGKCPLTGGEPCPDLRALADKDQIEADVAKLDSELQEIESDLTSVSQELKDSLAYERQWIDISGQLAALTKELDEVKAGIDPSFNLIAFEEAIAVDNETVKALREQAAKLETEKAIVFQQLSQFQGKRNAKAEEIVNATYLLEQNKELVQNLNILEQQLAQAQKQVAQATESLMFAKEQNEEAQKNKTKREFLEKVRQAFHQDNLPRMLIQSMLEGLNKRLNERLQEFAFPYSVAWTSEGGLVYGTPEGGLHKASQLSGGQKYVLVLALRCTILELLQSKFRLFVLDEPTTGLDTANREALSEVLSTLANSNLKPIMVVPTHDEVLLPEAKVIEI